MIEIRITRQKYRLHYKDYPIFFWLIYNDELFDKISGATLVRLLYLATQLPMRSNIICKQRSLKHPIKKSELSGILSISKREFNYFWRECSNNGILSINENGGIELSNKYFYRGNLYYMNTKGNLIRVFIPTMRELYKKLTPHEHKIFSNIFKLIPYMNRDTNSVYQSKSDISEILNYNHNNISRTLNRLASYSFICDRNEEKVIILESSGSITKIIINPLLFFAGKYYEAIRTIYFK